MRAGRGDPEHVLLPEPAKNFVFHSVVEGDDWNIGGRQAWCLRRGILRTASQPELCALYILLIPEEGLLVGDLFNVINPF